MKTLEDLVGNPISNINIIYEYLNNEVILTVDNRYLYKFYYDNEDCENISINYINGNLNNLCGRERENLFALAIG